MMKQKESKEDRFRRLAEARVNKILQLFRLLGNLSWTGTYAYTREQVEQIFTTLQLELVQTKMRFLQAQKQGKKRFSLGAPYETNDPAEEDHPAFVIPLPDGSYLRAVGFSNMDYPCINIYWDNACIFLKDNRCSVQEAKSLACRLYPFMVDPNGSGSFRYLYSSERAHHFRGPVVETRSWMKKNFSQESRAFMQAEFTQARPIAALLRRIPEHRKTAALLHFHRLRYSELDLDKPFLEQFQRNQTKLLAILTRMADEG